MALPQTPDGDPLHPGAVYAFGRTYVDHASELSNPAPEAPFYFLKAPSSVVGPGSEIPLPPGCDALHHEVELVVLIGEGSQGPLSASEALAKVAGYAVGVDFTDRALQGRLKAKALPWAAAKSFRGAAAISDFVPASTILNPQALELECQVNRTLRQRGATRDMIWTVGELLAHLSLANDLRPGDLIFTGTPAGVGPVAAGGRVDVSLVGHIQASFTVTAAL